MLNKVILLGRLVHDPTLRYTPTKKAICNFSLCVPRDYTGKEGTKEADFFRINVWGKSGESVKRFCKKGDMISVSGRLIQQKWTKNNERHYAIEVNADSIGFINLSKNKTKEDDFPEDAPEYTPEEGFGEMMDDFDEELPY